ncbi:hypothetical protein K6U06_18875 [Acidiferrimicrobium sp. IK]|jgi:hypothetical protein|uniref:hypothetical protein n=1 Tax=Acidiferrimicrobium sp. IK TaxID=2871700 RepID=UPI0021CB4F01|nr:hypothetical protein [Acidiferrimicrobium sp. IK]MCU4186439.1 hypothetical protein [Acidiferrimicrobium sp. IK]
MSTITQQLPKVDTPAQHRGRRRVGRLRPTLWILTLLSATGTATATLRARAAAARADESGNVITDNLAWIVFGVVAIVAIGALVKTLGSTVLNWVQTQLGV